MKVAVAERHLELDAREEFGLGMEYKGVDPGLEVLREFGDPAVLVCLRAGDEVSRAE